MSRRSNRYVIPYSYPYRSYRSAKYSNETIAFNTELTDSIDGGVIFPHIDENIPGVLIVPATTVLGNRKVKNFTIKVTANFNDDAIFGALVYVPQGTVASNLQVTGPSQSMYEPNQNVIATFVIPPIASVSIKGYIPSSLISVSLLCKLFADNRNPPLFVTDTRSALTITFPVSELIPFGLNSTGAGLNVVLIPALTDLTNIEYILS